MKRGIIYAIFSGLFLCITAVHADAKMRIAVLDFRAEGVDEQTARNISDLIRTELINTDYYTVIERKQMDMILKEQGFQQTGCTDENCAVQIGKLLSAKKILIGSVMRIGKSIVINGRIVDVEKGVAEFGEKAEAKTQDQILDAVSEFSKKLTMRIQQKGGDEDNDAGYARTGSLLFIKIGYIPFMSMTYPDTVYVPDEINATGFGMSVEYDKVINRLIISAGIDYHYVNFDAPFYIINENDADVSPVDSLNMTSIYALLKYTVFLNIYLGGGLYLETTYLDGYQSENPVDLQLSLCAGYMPQIDETIFLDFGVQCNYSLLKNHIEYTTDYYDEDAWDYWSKVSEKPSSMYFITVYAGVGFML